MNWKLLLGIFAKPLGATINSGIAAGAGAAIMYGSQHGVDTSISTPIVASFALAISTLISGFAATQGIQIPIINADPTNGVRVVSAKAADREGIPSQEAPIERPEPRTP